VTVVIAIVVLLIILLAIVLASGVRILREYERGVIFRLGRLIAQKGPGLIFLIPIVDRMVRVDLRTVTLTVPPQEVISKDNVTVRVNAVAYFRVIDPNRAVTEVENFLLATSQIAQTTLRSVLGKAELDSLLSERERLNVELQQIIDEQTEPWGVKGSRTSSCPPTCSGRSRARPRQSASAAPRSSPRTASSRPPRSSRRRRT
jgi:regulator of protease activity HflC (stomatin/prohibitin superfamily)